MVSRGCDSRRNRSEGDLRALRPSISIRASHGPIETQNKTHCRLGLSEWGARLKTSIDLMAAVRIRTRREGRIYDLIASGDFLQPQRPPMIADTAPPNAEVLRLEPTGRKLAALSLSEAQRDFGPRTTSALGEPRA